MNPRYSSPLCIIAAVVFAGCATFDRREMALIRQSGAPRSVVQKIEHGDPIAPSDIIALSRSGVPDSLIIQYLEDDGVDYLVTRADVLSLRRAGVRARVIDALMVEGDRFARDYAPSNVGAYDVSWGGSVMYGPGPYVGWW